MGEDPGTFMTRSTFVLAAAVLSVFALSACDGPQGDGVQFGVSLPTKVQAGVAGGSDQNTRAVGRVTDYEPYILNGTSDDEEF